MSERYGACRSCLGQGSRTIANEWLECGMCGGTGFSGDAMDYIDPSNALRIRSSHGKPRFNNREAIELAVQALTSSQKTIRQGS